MKKLITIMLVAIVPFVTMAQKRSKKDKKEKQEVKIPTVKFMVIKGVSLSQGDGADIMTGDMIEGEQGLMGERIPISFDFGTHLNKEAYKLIEKSRKLYSMMDAVNMLSYEGWEFISANIVQQGSVTTYYYYMKKE